MAFIDALPYVQMAAQTALIFAAIFAGYQLYLHRREREEQAALEILTRLATPQFQESYADIWDVPIGASAEEVRQRGRNIEDSAEVVAMTFETIGVMVYHRIVPLAVVDEVIGGFLRESWRRLEKYFEWKREVVGSGRVAEWYQWLADQVDVDRKRRSKPAYEAFKGWRP